MQRASRQKTQENPGLLHIIPEEEIISPGDMPYDFAKTRENCGQFKKNSDETWNFSKKVRKNPCQIPKIKV
jgi:hypothetical protein